MGDRHSPENQMTVEAFRENKWAAVDLPLPQDASKELLTAARAAEEEEKPAAAAEPAAT